MADEKYTIQQSWHDVLIYDEGDGRRLEFSCGSMDKPPCVTVPSRELWLNQTPAWAHEKRSIIIDRLRAADCIVREQGSGRSSVLSPDQTFRLETYEEYDDRTSWQTTEILTVPDDHVVAKLFHAMTAPPAFPSPGFVVLRFSYGGMAQVVRVNVHGRTFSLDDSQVEEPLDQLSRRLKVLPAVWRAPKRRGERFGNFLALFAAIVFVPSGIWMAIDGKTRKDRLIGVFGALLFGAAGLVLFFELCRRKKRGRDLPPREEPER